MQDVLKRLDNAYKAFFIETDFGTIPLDDFPEMGMVSNEVDAEKGDFDMWETNEEEISMEVEKTSAIEPTKYKPTEWIDYPVLLLNYTVQVHMYTRDFSGTLKWTSIRSSLT